MRNIILTAILLSNISRLHSQNNKIATIDSLSNKSSLYVYYPDSTTIDKMKKKYGANFYTMVDDEYFQFNNVCKLLDNNGIKYKVGLKTQNAQTEISDIKWGVCYRNKNNKDTLIEVSNFISIFLKNKKWFLGNYLRNMDIVADSCITIHSLLSNVLDQYNVLDSCSGDINNDGKADYIFVLKEKIEDCSYAAYQDELEKRGLIIKRKLLVFLGCGSNKYRLLMSSDNVIASRNIANYSSLEIVNSQFSFFRRTNQDDQSIRYVFDFDSKKNDFFLSKALYKKGQFNKTIDLSSKPRYLREFNIYAYDSFF